MEFQSVNKMFEQSIKANWDREALSNYNGITLHYRDVARRIAKLHIVFEQAGLAKGGQSRHLWPQPGQLGRVFPGRPDFRRRPCAHTP